MVTTPAVKQPEAVNHNNINNPGLVIEDDTFQDQFDGMTSERS
jgi:hypothetical protein